jgi:hypothetical protein
MTTDRSVATRDAELTRAAAEKAAAQSVGVQKSLEDLRKEAGAARSEVASTLDAIEYKLNIPKQVKINGRRLSFALHRLGDENPAALGGVAAAAAVAVGGIVWWGIRAVLPR